jgi:hypothetical protein
METMAAFWRRIFSGAISVKWFGALGNGVTDDTDAISGHLYYQRSKGDNPSYARKYGINKKSNTKWVGDGYASSILKLRDNSTSGGVDPQMIYANAKLSDIGFYSLGFDLNGTHNTTSTQANVAAIWFSGEHLEVSGMIVEGCKFYHGPGGTVILIENGATSWSGYPLDEVLILNNASRTTASAPRRPTIRP